MKIKIGNPAEGNAKFTSDSRARGYIASGIAYMRDGQLWFHNLTRLSGDIRQSTAGMGGLARREELRHYPVVGDTTKLFVRLTKGSRSAAPSRKDFVDQKIVAERGRRERERNQTDRDRFSLRSLKPRNGATTPHQADTA